MDPIDREVLVRTGRWYQAFEEVLNGPPREDHWYWSNSLGSESLLNFASAYESSGMDNEADRHLRIKLSSGGCLHIKFYHDAGKVAIHWDEVDLQSDPVGHAIVDAPLVALGIAGLGLLLFNGLKRR